ncbi:hypothetical protein [Streptomyces sp. NPDC002851]
MSLVHDGGPIGATLSRSSAESSGELEFSGEDRAGAMRTSKLRTTVTEVGFAAFVQLQHVWYHAYASARLRDAQATVTAVERTFDLAAGRWRWLLGQPSPAAEIWCQLRDQVNDLTTPTLGDPDLRRLYGGLPGKSADCVVLCRRLGLDARRAADVMGVEGSEVEVCLRLAERRSSCCRVLT